MNRLEKLIATDQLAVVVDLISGLPYQTIETRSVQFFSHHGKTVFKLYIRRNKDKSFVAEQLEKFEALKTLAACKASTASFAKKNE